jgi:hypothetical protein
MIEKYELERKGNAMTEPLIKGLIHVTGEPDSGKTTFALSSGTPPEKIVFLDADLKTQSIADQLRDSGAPLGVYHNLTREFEMLEGNKRKPVDFYNYVMGIIDKIETGKYSILIFDNWSHLEGGIRAKSMEQMSDISDLTWGQINKMQQLTWPATYRFYEGVLDRLLSIAPTVFLITHLKEKYIGNTATGLKDARGQRPVREKSSMRIWLRHNPDGPEPIGLVLKRPMRVSVVDGALKPISILPRRIKPCTWEKIAEYFESPIQNREPTEEETPNAFELSVLDGILTEDQKDVLRAALQDIEDRHESEAIEAAEFAGTLADRVAELTMQGKTILEISQELGVSPAEVAHAKN